MSVKSKVFVTGASGKIGKPLVKELLNKGFEVVALVRDKNKVFFGNSNIILIEGDIVDTNKYVKQMRDCDYVFHLAAYQNVFDRKIDEFKRVNIEGTKLIIKSLESSKIKKFIYVSTVMVLENKSISNFYVSTKSIATEMVKKSKLPWVILYPRTVIDKMEIVGTGLWKILTGGIPGGLMLRTGDKNRHFKFIWIEDLIKMMTIGVENEYKPRKSYILGDEDMKPNEYLKLMHQLRHKLYIPWRIPFNNAS